MHYYAIFAKYSTRQSEIDYEPCYRRSQPIRPRPSTRPVTQAFLEQAPAVVGADLWRRMLREAAPARRPDLDPLRPAVVGVPPDSSPVPVAMCWCPQARNKRRGPCGPGSIAGKCNWRWRNGETGQRSDDWSCWLRAASRRRQADDWSGGTRHALRVVRIALWQRTGPRRNAAIVPRDTGGDAGPQGPAPSGTAARPPRQDRPRSATFECRWCERPPRAADRRPHRRGRALRSACGASYARRRTRSRRASSTSRRSSTASRASPFLTWTRARRRARRPPKRATRHVKIRLKMGRRVGPGGRQRVGATTVCFDRCPRHGHAARRE